MNKTNVLALKDFLPFSGGRSTAFSSATLPTATQEAEKIALAFKDERGDTRGGFG